MGLATGGAVGIRFGDVPEAGDALLVSWGHRERQHPKHGGGGGSIRTQNGGLWFYGNGRRRKGGRGVGDPPAQTCGGGGGHPPHHGAFCGANGKRIFLSSEKKQEKNRK